MLPLRSHFLKTNGSSYKQRQQCTVLASCLFVPLTANVSVESPTELNLLCLAIACQLSFEVIDLCAFFAEVVVK